MSKQNSKKMTMKRVAATTALGVGLVAGGAGIASASSSQPSSDSTAASSTSPPSAGDFAGGVITAVSSDSITVKDMTGTSTTYTITSTTTFREGATTVTESTLAVGQHVGIQLSSSDSTTASSIDVQLPMLVGTVTAVDGDTVTISDQQGFSRTIVVDSTTTYTDAGSSASLSDVTVGTLIGAQGTVDANLTSLDASSVSVGLPTMPGGGAGGPGMGGPGFGPPPGNAQATTAQ
jgi:endonuclease YncB( thermonuclease family)